MFRHRIASLIVALALTAVGSSPAHGRQVDGATYWPVGYQQTFTSWIPVDGAADYAAFVNGARIPVEISTPMNFIESGRVEATVRQLLGPADVLEIAAIDEAGVVGVRSRAVYGSHGYVFIPTLQVLFDANRTVPDAAALRRIRAFAQLLTQHGFTRIIAIGHDAGVVGAPNAYRTGMLRAQSVAAAVARLTPVAASVASGGNSYPLASNDTAGGRATNRRVELGLR